MSFDVSRGDPIQGTCIDGAVVADLARLSRGSFHLRQELQSTRPAGGHSSVSWQSSGRWSHRQTLQNTGRLQVPAGWNCWQTYISQMSIQLKIWQHWNWCGIFPDSQGSNKLSKWKHTSEDQRMGISTPLIFHSTRVNFLSTKSTSHIDPNLSACTCSPNHRNHTTNQMKHFPSIVHKLWPAFGPTGPCWAPSSHSSRRRWCMRCRRWCLLPLALPTSRPASPFGVWKNNKTSAIAGGRLEREQNIW